MFQNNIAMNTPTKIFTVAFAVFAALLTSDAQAQLSYEFYFDQANYTVAPGSTVDMDLFLRETSSGGSIPRLAVGNADGLFAFGVNVDFSSAVGGAASSIVSDADVAIDAIFDDFLANQVDDLGTSTDIFGAVQSVNGYENAETSPGVHEVHLATLTVTGGDDGSVTDFVIADHTDTAAAFTNFADFFVIDDIASYGSATVSVVAIPEPATAMLLFSGLAGVGLLRRRR